MIRIHHWRNEYRVPSSLPQGAAIARDYDRLAERLAQSFAALAGTLPDLGDDGVLLLRELEVECDIDISCPTDQVVQHWSRQLAGAFLRALDDGRALRFPTRAAYEARFIADLLQGRAWDSWMYHRFDGLRVLPAAAVIRTLLAGDTQHGCAVLARLPAAAWPLLFAALSPREAVRILAAWRIGQDGTVAAMQATTMPIPALPGAYAPPLIALWLMGSWLRAGDIGSVHTACWAAVLLALPATMRMTRIAAQPDGAAMRAIARCCDDPDWLRLLAASSRAHREAAARLTQAARALEQHVPRAHTPREASGETFDAPCAGLVWLLPALRQLLDGALAAALPPHREAGPANLATLCGLAIAAGPRAGEVLRDPFWRTFLAIPPGFNASHWLEHADPGMAERALERALQAQAMEAPVLLRFSGREVLVERSSACPLWMAPNASGAAIPWRQRLMLTRLARRDAAWVACALLPPRWRPLFETLALAALRRTANRIPGALRCSLPWLFANILDVRGQARHAGNEAWLLEPARPPLYVLLSLNGMARLRFDRLVVQCAD
jgi:hypothetical protein